MRKVKISIEVLLDDKNIPQEINWSSDDPPSNGQPAPSKAFFLSIFDKEKLETLKIDLWTTKFEIGEMNRMMYHTLRGMSDSYHQATSNVEMSNDMARFTQYFGEQVGIIKKTTDIDNDID